QAPLIRAATLLVWGDDDNHIPLSEGLRLRDAIPDARLIVFRNCGHLPPTEYPEKFVEVVADFCASRDNLDKKSQRSSSSRQRRSPTERLFPIESVSSGRQVNRPYADSSSRGIAAALDK